MYGINHLGLYNFIDFSSELINGTTRKFIQGPYNFNPSIHRLRLFAMLRSIKTNGSDIYAYFNIASAYYINNTNYIEILIENKYGRLKEICLSILIYH